jgi:hypothetical protein
MPRDAPDPRPLLSGRPRPGRWLSLLQRSLVVAAAVSLAAPATATAHLGGGTLSSDFEARISGLRPPAKGVSARVLGGDQRLQLSVRRPRVVIVLGLVGEPFLRFSPTGVQANAASPTALSTHVLAESDALPPGPVRWKRVEAGGEFAWHENRLRPVPVSASGDPRRVAGWSVPLVIDGRPAVLTGSEWHATAPSLWPWLLAGGIVLAAAAAGARQLSAAHRRIAICVLLPLSVASLLAGWAGVFLADRTTTLNLVVTAILIAPCVLAALLAAAGAPEEAGTAALALVAGLVAAFALPELAMFGHGFVLSALPDRMARIAAVTPVAAGVATAILCTPAVIETFTAPAVAAPQDVRR